MFDNGDWTTILMICGNELSSDPLDGRLSSKRMAFVEVSAKSIDEANSEPGRRFDRRAAGMCGKYWLSSAQRSGSLAKQLEYWQQLLTPLSDRLDSLSRSGVFILLDCVGTSAEKYVQFHVPSGVLARLSNLGVSLEIATWGDVPQQ